MDHLSYVRTIPSGESRTLEAGFDPDIVRSASIRLLYKRAPYVADEEATVVEQVPITF